MNYQTLLQQFSPSNTRIDQEWEALPQHPTIRKLSHQDEYYKAATANFQHNRYRDVLQFEKTRVKLSSGNDYINANYIDLPFTNYRFIATQAPLPITFEPFWDMVWENDVAVIIMLTRLIEGRIVKAHRYWPDEQENEHFKDLQVFVSRCYSPCTEIQIREFTLLRNGESRSVSHIHYTEWHDSVVPNTSKNIRQVYQIARLMEMENLSKREKTNKNPRLPPIVIHCSAGIGRVGTFLSYVSVIEALRKNIPLNSISIPDIVASLRSQRMGMVQTKIQYEFIYKMVLDHLLEVMSRSKSRASLTKSDSCVKTNFLSTQPLHLPYLMI